MNHLQFIEKHVREDLLKKGYTPGIAQGGVAKALEYYRRVSQSSGKGKMIDDCLREGRLWAEKYSTKQPKSRTTK
ncbi:hypothetical protein H4F39_07400 [Pectobacterium brasiliense]|uniref:hypothetical protein n=1 Tax=Pectobacterium brasiliense TaxID=180957 RepID=UPI001969D195|nr:hypothetical protein [Pectobacterium brasiliense]MBN3093514.1 hypothetical protein [Pectobacterium brasiliense]